MRGRLFAAVLATSLLATAVAAAGGHEHERQPNLAAVTLQHIADCVYARQQAYVLEMLATVPGSYEEERVGKMLDTRLQQCFGVSSLTGVNFTWAALRGALAEAAYRTRYPTDPGAPSAADPYASVPPQWVAAATADVRHFGLSVGFHLIVACAVNGDPAAADKVIRTLPTSDAESRALTALIPQFRRCLKKDSRFSTDALTLRAQIAEALYDRMTPSVATGAQGR